MPKPKGAGDLRHKVKFQRRPIDGDDGYGNPEGDFADLGIVRSASLTPTRGGEDVQAGRVTGKALWDCWVRNDSGTRQITTGDRVVDARDPSRIFNIRFIGDMDGDRTWLLIQLESGGRDVSEDIEGLNRLMARFAAMPDNVRKRAGQQAFMGAEDMVATMKSIAPRDDGDDGDQKLVDHIYHEEGRLGDISYVVISDAKDSKGRPKAPRVELGHVAEDGTQVPAVPHFYPVVRTLGSKIKRRIASAVTRELRKK